MKQNKLEPIKVVVDTNILVDAIFHNDLNCQSLLKYKHDGEILFCMNKQTFQEAFTIFTRTLQEIEKRAKDKNITINEKQSKTMFYKLTNALWEIQRVDTKSKTEYCKEDIDDNKFINCCIDGNIKYLITSDKHLLHIKDNDEILKQGIQIITPHEFSLELLRIKFENK